MLKSSIGRKFLMAITGAVLLGFVIAHMLGNLQIFLGPKVLNTYARGLQELGALLWVARIGLLVAFIVHIALAIQLQGENKEARPIPYEFDNTVKASLASRTMLLTGYVVLAFVLYHLAHFTFHMVHAEHISPYVFADGKQGNDVYRMVILGFKNWFISGLYIVAQLVLGMHLSHGSSSMFQSLGINHPKLQPFLQKVGPTVATIIVIGNVSIPVAVLIGLVK